jgi:hypothetical protein
MENRDISWAVIPTIDNNTVISETFSQLEKADGESLPANNHWFYIEPLLNSFYKEQDCFIAIAKSNDSIVAILPLVISQQTKFGYRWSEFGLPFHKHMNLVALNKIPQDQMHNAFTRLEQEIESLNLSWDRFAIRNLFVAQDILISNSSNFEYSDESAWFDTSNVIELSEIISKKHIKNLNRLNKRLLNHDESCSLSEFYKPTDIIDQLAKFSQLEEMSWKGQEGVAINSSPKIASFYSDLMTSASLNQQARIFHYASDNHIYASALGFQLGDCLYIHKICFDASYMEMSPGGLLIFEIIKRAALDEKINKVSLVTYPEWAKRWHPQHTSTLNYVSYNSSITGRLLQFVITSWRNNKPIIKRLLSKFQQLAPNS